MTALDADEWAEDGTLTAQQILDSLSPEVRDELAGLLAPPDEPPPPLHFPTLPAFVAHFGTWYRRDVFDSKDRLWCPEWWQHPEAVVRLDATWRELESARLSPTGISAWLRDHADIHMAQLMQPQGAFRGCSAKGGHKPEDNLPPLPVVEPPDDWWTRADSGL